LKQKYFSIFLNIDDIDDSTERWDDIDINASKNDEKTYPSGPTVFWNDMIF